MIRVVVAEDSLTMRALLVRILTLDPAIRVVGEARTGVDAVEMTARLRPDVVTMDIEMPVMDGLGATREIMTRVPTPIVVISAATNRRLTDLSLDATAAGALCVLRKPEHPHSERFDAACAELVATVKAMAQVKVVRRWHRGNGAATVPLGGRRPTPVAPTRLVAIAASTGGPAVLQRILGRLPLAFPPPVLVVQHIADGFTPALVDWLDAVCRVRVKIAEHGERLASGVVYVAPDQRHLGVDGARCVALTESAPIGGFRPSATHLFASTAAHYGAGLAAVILTGMGADGVDGLRTVHASGGRVLAQDEESCVVFGMPGEAVRAGLAHAVLSPDAIADRLILYAGGL